MKKLSILAAVLCLGFFAAAPASASEGVPVDVSVSLPGGATNAAAVAYTAGYAAPAHSALRPLAVSWTCAGLSATNTIKLGKAVGGVAWKSVTASGTEAASGVALVTDEWYWRRGGTLAVSASVTNAMTLVIHCLER